jgi:hypothetical protein
MKNPNGRDRKTRGEDGEMKLATALAAGIGTHWGECGSGMEECPQDAGMAGWKPNATYFSRRREPCRNGGVPGDGKSMRHCALACPSKSAHFAPVTGGTDHRFLWSVAMGRRPARFHEELPPKVGQTIGFCRLSSSAVMAGRCFFDPAGPGGQPITTKSIFFCLKFP